RCSVRVTDSRWVRRRGTGSAVRMNQADPPTRPFSLRGVVMGARMDADLSLRYGYCADRQVGLVYSEDSAALPLLKHTKPGPTPVTSGTTDGQPGKPPPEEMANPDYQSD
ncbi:MAG: hypothetical protein ACRDTC_26925, partial [Pseudonocardiaceae bacterium]